MAAPQTSFWKKELSADMFAKAFARFWRWERQEFHDLFPPATLRWLLDRGERELVLRSKDGEKQLTFESEKSSAPIAPVSADEILASSLDVALSSRGVTREAARIALEMEPECFFLRQFDIPAVAQVNLPRLLVAEIERKTPFKASDVLYGHALSPSPGAEDKLRVTLCILRRDLFDWAIEGSGVAAGDIDLVRPAGPAYSDAPTPVIVVGRPERGAKAFRNVAAGLAALAAVLFLVGAGARIWRQDSAGAEVDARLAEVSERASHVRQIAARASAESRLLAMLRQERQSRPALADLWEEVSRLLPDGSFVIEMNLHESKPGETVVDLVGLSDSAVGLPASFDKSPLFSDAALTAPITPDAGEKRERFSLRVVVKQLAAGLGAGKAK